MMSATEEDIKKEIQILRKGAATSLGYYADFSKRHFNGPKENAILFCLDRAIDLASGCVQVAQAQLPESSITLMRGLLENLFWICWILLSDKNAQRFVDAGINELEKQLRILLEKGEGRVIDDLTGDDISREMLEEARMQEIGKMPKVEEVARVAGLEKLYDRYYRFASQYTHGHTFGISKREGALNGILMAIAMVGPLLDCINLVVCNWVTYRRQTPLSEIYEILKP
jgi:Family of unknown function (DUF5677)